MYIMYSAYIVKLTYLEYWKSSFLHDMKLKIYHITDYKSFI